MRTARLLVATPLAAALLGAAAAPALAAPSTPGIGVAPATPQPGGVSYFVNDVAVGATARDTAVVANSGSTPVTVEIYPVDGLTSQSSGAVYGNRGQTLHGAGTWLSVPNATLTVGPHSRQTVMVNVQVPPSATPGDHLAGVAFQEIQVASRTSGALTVRTVTRSVLGVLIRIPGAATAAMTIRNLRLVTLAGFGTAAVDMQLTNVGGLLVKPRLTVELAGPAGYRRDLTHQLDTILPGDSITFPQPWPDRLTAGRYRVNAMLTADGMAPVAEATSIDLGRTLAPTRAGEAPQIAVVPHRWHLSADAAIAGAALLLASLGGLTLVTRRKRCGGIRHSAGRHAARRSGADSALPQSGTRERTHAVGSVGQR